MTDLIFFDTDALSSFLSTDNEYLLDLLYENRIIIPESVKVEISRAGFDNSVLETRLNKMIKDKKAKIMKIEVSTEEFRLYSDFISGRNEIGMAIGKGEASCLALAICNKGIVVSNNLRDVTKFVDYYGLRHKTTTSILNEAYEKNIISINQGDMIWSDMLDKNRKIGSYDSFSEYMSSVKNDI